jgi:hypothetical protein
MMTIVSMMPAVMLDSMMTNWYVTNLSSVILDAATTFLLAHGPKYASADFAPSLFEGM